MFSDPVKNLKAFNLRENMVVADLGAGSGFYTIPLAKIVSQGKVYAVEIQKDFLTTIVNKTKEAHLNNVECLWGDIEKKNGTKIKDETLDAVLASNIFFQLEDKDSFVREVKRILKFNGKVLLIDWSDNLSSLGVSFNKIIPKERAIEMFQKEGFVFEREIDAGDHHYGIILIKGNESR